MDLVQIMSFVSLQELPENDIIINIKKGYALRRLGVYSPNVEEQIVHSFVSLNDLCIASPNVDVCIQNTQLRAANMFELAVVMTPHDTVYKLFSYDKDAVSKLVRHDIDRILTQYNPGELIDSKKGNIHFINNRFHHQNHDDKALVPSATNNVLDIHSDVPRVRSTAAEIIIQRISSHKIDFDYLSSTELDIFLSTIFSNSNTLQRQSNVKSLLNSFTQLVVGQVVYGLPYCAINQHDSSTIHPCLVISTVFLRTPADHVSTFSVYKLIPLPISYNYTKFIYTNLPKLVGINTVDKKLVLWNDDSDIQNCIFSTIILCQHKPVSMSLLNPSCLFQLFDENQLATNLCAVSISKNIQEDALHVAEGWWLFHNVYQTLYCQIHSHSETNELPETISITQPAIVDMSCDRKITCTNFQLPVEPCRMNKVIIKSNFDSNKNTPVRTILPVKDMSDIILSSYYEQMDKSRKELFSAFNIKKKTLYQTIHELTTYILGFICLILIIMTVYIFKFMKYKLQKEVNNLHSEIDDIINF
ncbi:hypothetical protein I4U23_011330 [Adineta vaga]|nr:hypothetical protein I4U23_011330 [Adineta vaga]